MEQNNEIIALTETFVTGSLNCLRSRDARISHREAHRIHTVGRPGGRWSTEHEIPVWTKRILVMWVYLPPVTEVTDIVEEMAGHDDRSKRSSAVIYGDFNCRIDSKSWKSL